MKPILTSLLLMLVCISFSGCSNPTDTEPEFTPGQLLVHHSSTVSGQDLIDIVNKPELEWIEFFEHVRIIWVGVPEGEESNWITTLEAYDEIISVSQVRNNVTLR